MLLIRVKDNIVCVGSLQWVSMNRISRFYLRNRQSLAVALLLAAIALPLSAQVPTLSDLNRGTDFTGAIPDWDVALVKPHPSHDGGMSLEITSDGISLTNLTLEQMICNAWRIHSYEVSGLTGWMTNAHYDLQAKVSSEDAKTFGLLSAVQQSEMLKKLILERFQLKTHVESKLLSTYNLIVVKRGAKMTESRTMSSKPDRDMQTDSDQANEGDITMGPGLFDATGVRIETLIRQLESVTGKPIHDATGLKGRYDIHLRFRLYESTGDSEDAAAARPSLSVALQEELGLKLLPTTGPVLVMVVEGATPLKTE